MRDAITLAEKLREFESYCCAGGVRRDILFEVIEFLTNEKEGKMRKILVSGGYGAGWSTWNDKPQQVAEYAPIIKFLEDGGDRMDLLDVDHPLIVQMCEDLGLEPGSFYTGGAKGLRVETVNPPYLIEEYDGSEWVRVCFDMWT